MAILPIHLFSLVGYGGFSFYNKNSSHWASFGPTFVNISNCDKIYSMKYNI